MNFTGLKINFRKVFILGALLYLPCNFVSSPLILNLCALLPSVSRLDIVRCVLRIYADETKKRKIRMRNTRSLAGFLGTAVKADQLEQTAKWRGERGALVQAMDKCGFFFTRHDNVLGTSYRLRGVSVVSGIG